MNEKREGVSGFRSGETADAVRGKRPGCFILTTVLFLVVFPALLFAGDCTGLSRGQKIYVPAYSHIYSGNTERPFLLAVTLSVRNVDPGRSITITVVDYYATQGMHLKHYLTGPKTLKPLESLRYVIPESDKSGGSGANFMVEWTSDRPVNPPIVEAVMIGAQSQQGISFTSRGQVLVSESCGK
ncbi:DUF3124 domain-containing protein [Desulfatiferula olefinivorans]